VKALIVGAAGQVGRALAACTPAGVAAVALSRESLDVTDPHAVASAVKAHAPDLLFNAAAYTAVDQAEREIEAAYRLNRDAPTHLARAARACGARLVHISTDFVFDGRQGIAYRPSDAPNPLSVYGSSKLAGEQAVSQEAPDALIVRTAWVYGVHGGNFVKTMLRLMVEREQVLVVADQIGTPTHAASLALALWALAGRGVRGLHHFTDAGSASWYDFAVAIQEEALCLGLLEKAVPVLPITSGEYPTPAKRPPFSLLDKSQTYALIGPASHWRSELRTMLRALRDQPNG